MAGLILLKARSKFMASPMYRNSMVLIHGGAKKRCIDRFNRIGVYVNHSATLKKIKEIADTWDAGILEWKKVMCDSPSLEDLSWMDEPGCSTSFLSDHTYHCEEKEVEEVFTDTSSESEGELTDHDTRASRRTESGCTDGSSPTAMALESQDTCADHN
ncbi:uncharacterized protein LOC127425964 isoform X2 [Myxocyprinus asiaticus]|uniref:uncharacterized protein LOC127425964 isoform X2 n=1 Tax=Myxocyprinus asiaticus TaxID=70543 RepID=UPI002223531F|nr:uncharacterized protein LOC127425964 isoform X2 [Myxocyprinus asiaticus]